MKAKKGKKVIKNKKLSSAGLLFLSFALLFIVFEALYIVKGQQQSVQSHSLQKSVAGATIEK